MNVPFYRHSLSAAGHAALIGQVLDSPFLTTGQQAAKTEEVLRAFFGVRHAKLTSSWTQGAVAALLALGIGPGDEVIVPAMTFVATANVVKLVGATPVFADADPETLLIDIDRIREAVTARTRAVIPVHLYGQMVDVAAVRGAVRAGIAIVEDAAHCFEGTLRNRRPGQDGDVAIFSFYATKNVTCGEGGAVISNDPDFADKLAQTVLHGMSAGAAKRFDGGRYNHWDVARLGTKANLPDLLAVLLPPQIANVEAQRERREKLAARYERHLAGTLYQIPKLQPEAMSARHLFAIGIPNGARDAALRILSEKGIGATVNYRALTGLTLYKDAPGIPPGGCPIAEAWGDSTLSLPLYPGMGERDQDTVLDVLLNDIMPIANPSTGPRIKEYA